MALGKWLKLSATLYHDPKMLQLTYRGKLVFTYLLTQAKLLGNRGVFQREQLLGQMMAPFLGMEAADCDSGVQEGISVGLLEENANSVAIRCWGKWQIDSTGAERQRKYREKRGCDDSNALRNGVTRYGVTGDGQAVTSRTEIENETRERVEEDKKEKNSPKPPLPAEPPRAIDQQPVMEVFSFWKKTMKHTKAKPTTQATEPIRKAMFAGYDSADLMLAIKGCAGSKFHMGKEGKGVHNSLELICRADKLDKFIALGEEAEKEPVDFYGRKRQQWGAKTLKEAKGL